MAAQTLTIFDVQASGAGLHHRLAALQSRQSRLVYVV